MISARAAACHDLVPYDEVQAKELTTQALTDEKLEVVEVLGQTALYQRQSHRNRNCRRGYTDTIYDPAAGITATVDRRMPSDHSGTILVKAPLYASAAKDISP